jgi:hypothetical protein
VTQIHREKSGSRSRRKVDSFLESRQDLRVTYSWRPTSAIPSIRTEAFLSILPRGRASRPAISRSVTSSDGMSRRPFSDNSTYVPNVLSSQLRKAVASSTGREPDSAGFRNMSLDREEYSMSTQTHRTPSAPALLGALQILPTLLAIVPGTFMAVLHNTVVSVALPNLCRSGARGRPPCNSRRGNGY